MKLWNCWKNVKKCVIRIHCDEIFLPFFSTYSVGSGTSAIANSHWGHYSKHPGQNLTCGHNQIYSHPSAERNLHTSVQGNFCMTPYLWQPPQWSDWFCIHTSSVLLSHLYNYKTMAPGIQPSSISVLVLTQSLVCVVPYWNIMWFMTENHILWNVNKS